MVARQSGSPRGLGWFVRAGLFVRLGLFLGLGLLISRGLLAGAALAQNPALPQSNAEQELLDRLMQQPAVVAIAQSNPQTTEELLRASKLLIGLGQPNVARPFVQKLAEKDYDQAAVAKLLESFEPPLFLEISQEPKLQPEGQAFAKKIFAHLAQVMQDPARIAALVAQLKSPSAITRGAAAGQLRSAGTASAPALIGALGDPGFAQAHSAIRATIVDQGLVLFYPLLAALKTEDEAQKAQVIRTLQSLNNPACMPFLLRTALSDDSSEEVKQVAGQALEHFLGRIPSKREAVSQLYTSGQRYYQRDLKPAADAEGKVEVWRWDAAKKSLTTVSLTADYAALDLARQLAADAYHLNPAHDDVRRLYLGTLLENAQFEAGLAMDLPTGAGTAADEAKSFGAKALEEVLEQSLATIHAPAATAAVRLLGEIGTADLVYSQGAKHSTLLKAATAPDPRVRLAAIETVFRLDPKTLYPGAGSVIVNLGYYLQNLGKRRAVVLDGLVRDGRRVAALLNELGYDADLATDEREFFRLAARGDVELVMIGMFVPRSRPEIALDQLRHDPRTKNLPVGIIVNSDETFAGGRVARRDALSTLVVRPTDAKTLEFELKDILDLRPPGQIIPSEERLEMAARVLKLLGPISENQSYLYDVSRLETPLKEALLVPDLNAEAATVLGNLGTRGAQRALLDYANFGSTKLEARQAAAKAFIASIALRGTNLTTKDVQDQYDRYNTAGDADPETQQVLGPILDAMEARVQRPLAPPPPGIRIEEIPTNRKTAQTP